MNKPISIYIHIPFCEKRCDYCDFYSTLDFPVLNASYRHTLSENIRWAGQQPEWTGASVQSIFFGGGTPNLYGPDALSEWIGIIQSHFDLQPQAEISMEMNPEFVSDAAILNAYLDAGLNRLSLGIQSLIPEELTLLGRIHSADKALNALKNNGMPDKASLAANSAFSFLNSIKKTSCI